MNEKDTMLEDKNVYLCTAEPSALDYMENSVIQALQKVAMDYQEQHGCRVIAPYAYLHDIVNYESAAEMEVAFWFCSKMMDFADALLIYGEQFTDRMRVEIDYALVRGIPILSRPENHAIVHEYLKSMERRNEDAQHL